MYFLFLVSLESISIHAPTRGATYRSRKSKGISRFQSTLPRGERPRSAPFSNRLSDFNPRSHEGSDLLLFLFLLRYYYFNPRSHEGSDNQNWYQYLYCYNFNPRSHEGSDYLCFILTVKLCNFNPRSHEGSDKNPCNRFYFPQISIHAPTRGATINSIFSCFISAISIHAPTRGATSILPKFYTLLLSKITNFIFTLHHLFITAVYSKKIFVHYFGCESLDIFMYACHSHLHYIIRISSAAIPRSIPTCSTFVLYLFPK